MALGGRASLSIEHLSDLDIVPSPPERAHVEGCICRDGFVGSVREAKVFVFAVDFWFSWGGAEPDGPEVFALVLVLPFVPDAVN